MITKLQVYISKETNPYKNLAVEKHLLDIVSEDCVILYLWQNENTVVIGRNQNPWAECRCNLLESENGKIARRLSGGGAVFHDLGNLNFTFISHTENNILPKQLEVICEACKLSGIKTEFSGRNDILADGKKFSGNAFFNSKGKSYHHGTLLISADFSRLGRYLTPPSAKIESKGIKSVKSRVINLSELSEGLTVSTMQQNMLKAFESVYGITPSEISITETKELSALADKYSSWEYIYGAHFPSTFSADEYFTWGHANLNLFVEKGKISDVKLFTDSMDWQLSQTVENALSECRFSKEDCEKALLSVLSPAHCKDIMDLIQKMV